MCVFVCSLYYGAPLWAHATLSLLGRTHDEFMSKSCTFPFLWFKYLGGEGAEAQVRHVLVRNFLLSKVARLGNVSLTAVHGLYHDGSPVAKLC